MKIGIKITDKGMIVATDGFTGKSCLKEAEKLIALLKDFGVEATMSEIKLKEEYHVREKDTAKNRQ